MMPAWKCLRHLVRKSTGVAIFDAKRAMAMTGDGRCPRSAAIGSATTTSAMRLGVTPASAAWRKKNRYPAVPWMNYDALNQGRCLHCKKVADGSAPFGCRDVHRPVHNPVRKPVEKTRLGAVPLAACHISVSVIRRGRAPARKR